MFNGVPLRRVRGIVRHYYVNMEVFGKLDKLLLEKPAGTAVGDSVADILKCIGVGEDQGMIDAVNAGALNIEKLEAMTCVCSVGLDMIAIPGDTPATTISGIIADEAAIGMVNQKATAVRVIPVIGKRVGDSISWGGLLGHAPIMPVNTFSSERLVNRGGRIPAPVHSFKN